MAKELCSDDAALFAPITRLSNRIKLAEFTKNVNAMGLYLMFSRGMMGLFLGFTESEEGSRQP